MTDFTPASALAGGLLIGTSASLLLILNGRIAGISGIVAGMFQRDLREVSWRAAFVVGMLLAPLALWRSLRSPAFGHVRRLRRRDRGRRVTRRLRHAPGVRVHQRSRRMRHIARIT